MISVFHKQESGEGYFILDYFDFKDCKIKSVGKKVLTSIYSINGWYEYDYKRLASADFEGVFDDSVITKDVIKYKINSDKSLEIEYNLLNQGSRGYSVATNMPNYSGYDPNKDYFVKILDKGTTIYFAGDEGTSWSTSYSKNLYKIKNFGQPEKIALNDKYAFTSGIVFADNGDISAVVTRDSDGADGLLTGNMETGEFDFKADEVFGSVTEIVLNF
ncbi:MAG: hypothetical protein HUK25_04055 [Treponema sp.]|nr:hypothetical protein [Treponema sp.]